MRQHSKTPHYLTGFWGFWGVVGGHTPNHCYRGVGGVVRSCRGVNRINLKTIKNHMKIDNFHMIFDGFYILFRPINRKT